MSKVILLEWALPRQNPGFDHALARPETDSLGHLRIFFLGTVHYWIEEEAHVTCVKQKTEIHSCFINSPKKATVFTRLCDVIMSALESYLESSGTALLQRACDMELLINTKWSRYNSTFLVFLPSFVWLMNECDALPFSTEWTTLSTLPLSNFHAVWWADWASWSWVEWSHSRRQFLLNERAWPVKLTHYFKPSHALLEAVISDLLLRNTDKWFCSP